MSDENRGTVLGYLSTIFWGYYSGKDRKIRSERAQGKVRLAFDRVSDLGVDHVATEIRAAYNCLMSDQYAEALRLLCLLPQLQLADCAPDVVEGW